MKRRTVTVWLTLAALVTLLVAGFAVQFVTPSSQAQSTPQPSPPPPDQAISTARTGSGRIEPQRVPRSTFRKTPPDQPPPPEGGLA